METQEKNQMIIKELTFSMPWGHLKAQQFGDKTNKAIICLHGYLDNSNSFKPLAPFLCNHGYYVIAFDLPGHGLSSKFPSGMIYSPKQFIVCLRRALRSLALDNFTFVSHSYGVLLSFMYDTIFPGEANATIAIDWIFGSNRSKWGDMSANMKIGIDEFLDIEKEIEQDKLKEKTKPLTYEYALRCLLDANNHLDEPSAKLLLERGLITRENGKLDFTRDVYAKRALQMADHYIEFVTLMSDMHKYMNAPILLMVAWPPAFGTKIYERTMELIDMMNKNARQTHIDVVKCDGSHHFHMIKPEETCQVIVNYLNELGTKQVDRDVSHRPKDHEDEDEKDEELKKNLQRIKLIRSKL